MATDLHGGLVQRQPPPRRFHIYRLSPRIFAAHAGTRTNHGTFQPCAGTSVASVHLYKAGASQYINYFVLPLSYSAQERPLPQAYAPCGCEARGHAYGADGWARTNGIHSTWRSNRLSYVCMRGVLVFPSCQIFSVPRFCQQITGAITTSRLEGLTSGLRITHTAVPLYARHSRCPRRIGGIGGDRTHDLLITNELLCQLSYDTRSPPCLRPGGRADVRRRGLRHRDRVPARIALGTPEEWM